MTTSAYEPIQWCRSWTAGVGNPEGLTKIHLREPGAEKTLCGRVVERHSNMRWTPSRRECEDEGYCMRCMRCKTKASLMAYELPEGWRIEREECMDYLRPSRRGLVAEVKFAVFNPDGDEATTPTVRYDGRHGEWNVNPGSMTSRLEPDEMRARGVAFLMAADECDHLRAEA